MTFHTFLIKVAPTLYKRVLERKILVVNSGGSSDTLKYVLGIITICSQGIALAIGNNREIKEKGPLRIIFQKAVQCYIFQKNWFYRETDWYNRKNTGVKGFFDVSIIRVLKDQDWGTK